MRRVSFLLIITAISAAFSFQAQAKEPTRNCFEIHLVDALQLNRQRLEKYANITEDRSIPISRKLIGFEKTLLPLSRVYDRIGLPYQKRGVPFLCEEFVSMEHTPEFKNVKEPSTSPQKFPKPSYRSFKRAIRFAYFRGFKGIYSTALKELKRLEKNPDYNCLYRHFVESISRVAYLAPLQINRARAKGLLSPKKISLSLIEVHLWGLKTAVELDEMAFPLQKEGVPILCQDVPFAGIH